MTPAPSKLWHLKHITLFQDLVESEMQELERVTKMERVKKRQPLYLPGDPGRQVYLLKAGRVKLSRLAEDGKEFTLAILEPGEIFGELTALEEDAGSVREEVAEALEDTMICTIRREDFEGLLRRHTGLAFRLTKLMGLRLKRIESRIEDLVFKDVPARLARLLLALADEAGVRGAKGVRLRLRLTHRELANLIGSTRETVSVTLGEFRRQGWIGADAHHLVLLSEAALTRVAQQHPPSR